MNSSIERYSLLKGMGEWALKLAGLFVILEPIWMLLPFAGFLYGSVLRIENLNQNPRTAWLTHFVFPVLTLGFTGPVLVVIGFIIFLIGACQIYSAKIRRTGLVTTGLYRLVRNPQYIALTLFGVGILLTWGRAIMWLAFFTMMFLYYYLAKSEERECLRLFGADYERYREKTSFIIPGDIALRPLGAMLDRLTIPRPLKAATGFLLMLAVCFGVMRVVDTLKVAIRSVPYMVTTVPLVTADKQPGQTNMKAGSANGISFVQSGRITVARGPYRNATLPGFAERLLERLPKSKELGKFLGFLDETNPDVAIVFCGPLEKPEKPGERTEGEKVARGPSADPAGPDCVRVVIMRCTVSSDTIADAFLDKSKRQIKGGCIAPVNLAQPADSDIVMGKATIAGPEFPGEERWDSFMQQMKQQTDDQKADIPVAMIGKSDKVTLVLVQAPILRTRLDKAFALEIKDRLVESPRFSDQLRNAGAGGNIVAVVFPRPGENWYREHHGKPQISLFVMLAQGANAGDPGTLFTNNSRKLIGAFSADMDFKIERPNDSVTGIAVVGRRRNLEERWGFFLSGVGGATGIHSH